MMEEQEKRALGGGERPEGERSEPERSGRARGDRSLLSRFLRLLVGLALSTLLGVGLGVLGFVGLPWLYRGFTEPVQANTTLVARQAAELADVRGTLAAVSSQEGEQLDNLQSQLAGYGTALDAQQDQIGALQSDLAALQRSMDSLSAARDRLARQDAALSELATEVAALQEAVESGGTPLQRLERRLLLTQASLHMLRGRIWLIENNAGLAMQEVEAARAAVAQAVAQTPAGEQAPLQEVAVRLDLTLEDLQLRPLIAAGDLEIAWQLLAQVLGDHPAASAVATSTPTPAPTATPTPET